MQEQQKQRVRGNKQMKRTWRLLLALTMVLVLLVGCTTPSTGPGPGSDNDVPSDEGSGIIRLTAGRPLETLNPHQQAATTTSDFLNLVQGKLYRFVPGADGTGYEIVDELAAGMPTQVDDEGTVWRVKVRDGLVWSNGEPLTADDILYSWKMCMDPLLLNHRADAFHGSQVQVVNALEYVTADVQWEDVGIKLIDDNTFEFTLILPVTEFMLKNFLSGLSVSVVYPELYEAGMNANRTETNYGTDVDKMVSSGPFMVSEWIQGSEYTAVKNPNYIYKDKVWLAGINTRVISESGTVMQLFENGEVDIVSLAEADYQRYREDPRVLEVPSRSVQRIVINLLNTNKPILQDVRFRQALYHATNRATCAEISTSLAANYIIPTTHVMDVSDGTLYRDTPEAKAILSDNYGYDPELAKQLFDAAMADAGLEKLSLQLDYHEGVEARRAESEYLQEQWRQIFDGRLEISLQAVPSSQLAAKLRDFPNNVNAFELGWTGTGHDDFNPVSCLAHYYSGTDRRKGPYFSDEYDALYEAILEMPIDDTQGRLAMIAQAEAIMLRDASFVPVTQGVALVLISERVTLMNDGWSIALGYGWEWAKVSE